MSYGIYGSRNNLTVKDYFLAGKETPWWIAMFSIVATETSVLTFVSIPGLAYRSDWFFLQLAFGYILGRILVAIYLLPQYFKGDIISIYEVIGKKFGTVVQKIASGIFLITRLFADGVRFLATAVVIQVITGWPIWVAVLIIGLVTTIYTLSGGIRTIVWIDSFQFILYLFGGLIVILFISNSVGFSGWNSIIDLNKMKIFRFTTENMFFDAWFVLSAFIGGALLSFASHGADYMMVQRVLTCKDLRHARLAMIGSGFFVFIQFMVFLCAGSLIWEFMDGVEIEKDRELASFIVHHLPIGLKGVLLAGVLSAAMSTLSSSINSLASSTINDWLGRKLSLGKSMLISGFWACLLILISLVFDEGDSAIIVLGFKIASFTYGGLLSLFILSKSKKTFKSHVLVSGLICGLGSVFIAQSFGIAWTWYIGISVFVNLMIVYFMHYFRLGKMIAMVFTLIYFIFFFNPLDYESGLDILSSRNFDELKDKQVGLIVNHTSLSSNGKHLVELIHSNNLNVVAIFSPEHGFKGMSEAGAIIEEGFDPLTKAPIHSLYGKTRKPTKEMLKDIDLLIFDIQDIGVRYYTYLSTLTLAMEAAAEKNIPFMVLDRINPLSRKVNGPILDMNYSSFVGMHPIPVQHGMTMGELAFMINEEGWLSDGLKVELKVIQHRGKISRQDRENAFNAPPSPNMPNLNTAMNYVGLCLLEGTNISEGRGTSFPFKLIGAPWIESGKLLDAMLPYMSSKDIVDTVTFIPKNMLGKSVNPKHENKLCHGLYVQHLENPIIWALHLFDNLSSMYPQDFKFLSTNFIDKLYGNDTLRLRINDDNGSVDDLIMRWKNEHSDFFKMSKKYYKY